MASCSNNFDCQSLGLCVPEDSASHFGQIVDKTCDNAYFRFDHVYQCAEDGAGWVADCSDSSVQGGCCKFNPKIQVLDNWGWCNGSCDGAGSPGGFGCYQNECESNPGSWDPYDNGNGKIIIPLQ